MKSIECVYNKIKESFTASMNLLPLLVTISTAIPLLIQYQQQVLSSLAQLISFNDTIQLKYLTSRLLLFKKICLIQQKIRSLSRLVK